MKIFRDDDIYNFTENKRFFEMDSLFKMYGVEHTIAVLTHRLEDNKELIFYIKENPHIKPQLHGYEHINHTTNVPESLRLLGIAVKEFEDIFGFKPTIFYPTWNLVNDELIKGVRDLGMVTSYKKESLCNYVKFNGVVNEEVLNWHYWADCDTMFLEAALKLATGK